MAHHTTVSGIANSDLADNTAKHSILNQIRQGMSVYDVRDNHIGSVSFVHFGAASETQHELGVGPATATSADSPIVGRDTLIGSIAEVFDPNDMPEQLQQKLLLSGYIRLDTAGLFAADRYITPDQIASVADDKVQLSVSRDQLVKRH